ncbi:MAG TPA: hypothetical protein VMR50_19750 [Myxococcota bacterium]|nr:hypothetical protein [Myxococcota bacterium]
MGRRFLRWLGGAVAAIAAAVGLLLAVARLHDGPLGPFSGGDFRSGSEAAVPSDWSFASAARTFELELPPGAGRSITAGFAVLDGKLYVPSLFARQKRWPSLVLADPRVRIRLEGKIYALRAARVEDPGTLQRVGPLIQERYGEHGVFGDRDWVFALTPR